jgi:hypothetical protein
MTQGTKALIYAWTVMLVPIVWAVVVTVRDHGWPF